MQTPHPPGPPSVAQPRRRWSWLWRTLGVVVGLVVLVGLLVTAYRLGSDGAGGFVEVPVGGEAASAPAELQPLIDLYQELGEDAVEEPDQDALVEGAIEGMLEALDDPYARFYDEQEYRELGDELDGTYSGVGMELQETEEGLFVVTVFPDSPAQEAGIRAGDRIIGVDGDDVRDAPIESVVSMVRGEEGTTVELELERDGETLEVEATRGEIAIPTLEASVLDDGTGHLQVFQFTGGVGDDVREGAEDLLADGAEGLVLDLRGNPGGLLREAVSVASVFLDDEVVVQVRERGGEEEELSARGDAIADVPLVVLVDQGTASAAEIVAAALQDHDRAAVVGTETFGKGTVQTVRDLSGGTGAKFTTAAYFTPSGDSIEEIGVQPDRVVERDDDQLAEDPDEDEQLSAAREELRSLIAERAE